MSEIPVWAYLVAASVGGPVVLKALDALFSRVIKKEDERAATVDANLMALSKALVDLKDYVRDRFDQLNARREDDSREITDRVHSIERTLPDQLRQAKHDAIDAVSPMLGKHGDHLAELETRVSLLERKAS